ncbi:MAG TPA: hypothetical protein VJ885_07215 [Thermoanaerobaculia bacterium]|nr:hypothetical protein [Thermoanaerobaculia bacterium]
MPVLLAPPVPIARARTGRARTVTATNGHGWVRPAMTVRLCA